MSSVLEDYKGLDIPTSTPSAGGRAIKDDFKRLVDWNAPSVWDKTTDPTVDDDLDAGFYPGSRWLNTTTFAVWTCLDNTAGTAVWQLGGSPSQNPGVVALTDGANIATNAALGNTFAVTLGGNRTLDNPTNGVDGQKCTWRIKQDGTGSRTITLGSAFRLGTDITAVTLSTAANKTDYMGAIYNAGDSKWDVVAFVRGF